MTDEMIEVNPKPDNNTSDNQESELFMHVVYGCFAGGFLTGGLTALVGLIISYIKRADVADSYLASHVTWAIRTFWWGLLFMVLSFIGKFVLTITIIFIFASGAFFLLTGLWFIYRIAKGWMALSKQEPIPNPEQLF